MKEYFVGILCLCSLCVNAQTIIDYHHQKYRIGDEVVGKMPEQAPICSPSVLDTKLKLQQ